MYVAKDFMLVNFQLTFLDITHLQKVFIMRWKCMGKQIIQKRIKRVLLK